MGADRTIRLCRDITDAEVEMILNKLNMRFNKQRWGWSSQVDISKVLRGLQIHYGYLGQDHIENAERKVEEIVKELQKLKILKSPGSWSY